MKQQEKVEQVKFYDVYYEKKMEKQEMVEKFEKLRDVEGEAAL